MLSAAERPTLGATWLFDNGDDVTIALVLCWDDSHWFVQDVDGAWRCRGPSGSLALALSAASKARRPGPREAVDLFVTVQHRSNSQPLDVGAVQPLICMTTGARTYDATSESCRVNTFGRDCSASYRLRDCAARGSKYERRRAFDIAWLCIGSPKFPRPDAQWRTPSLRSPYWQFAGSVSQRRQAHRGCCEGTRRQDLNGENAIRKSPWCPPPPRQTDLAVALCSANFWM